MSTHEDRKQRSLFDAQIMRRAIVDALLKLNPTAMMRNPVMFVVEVGSVLTTLLLFKDVLQHQGHFSFDLQITLWLCSPCYLPTLRRRWPKVAAKPKLTLCAAPSQKLRLTALARTALKNCPVHNSELETSFVLLPAK